MKKEKSWLALIPFQARRDWREILNTDLILGVLSMGWLTTMSSSENHFIFNHSLKKSCEMLRRMSHGVGWNIEDRKLLQPSKKMFSAYFRKRILVSLKGGKEADLEHLWRKNHQRRMQISINWFRLTLYRIQKLADKEILACPNCETFLDRSKDNDALKVKTWRQLWKMDLAHLDGHLWRQ